jgi:serine protease inhibitor
VSTPSAARISVTNVATAANTFGAKVLADLVGPAGDKTVVLSPYGISATLNMLTFAAEGATHTTLRRALGPSTAVSPAGAPPDWRIQIAHRSIYRALNDGSGPGITVNSANALWLTKRATLRPPYSRVLDDTFNATVDQVDFTSAGTLKTINGWASQATKGLIPQVMSELDPSTELVLANAVYFKGNWAHAFRPAATTTADFTKADGSKRRVAMMAARLNLDYAQGPGYHAIRLPYAGDRFTMTVLTAEDPAQSGKVWAELRRQGVANALANLRYAYQPINVRLPRFKTAFSANLNPVLTGLGLGPALGGAAKFTALTPSPINALTIMHKTLLDVSETGTEAAALTAAIATRSLEPEATPFSADRPFLLSITDATTGVQLFLGYIAEP